MVVTPEVRPVTVERLRATWNEALDRHRRWLAALVLLGAAFSLWEWWDASALPLAANRVELAEEWDWSVGALLDGEGDAKESAPAPERLRNAMLSLMAFFGQILIIALVLTFAYQMVIASTFFQRLSNPDGPYRLIPEPGSKDQRRGFELLSEFLEHSLILVVLL